MARQSSIPLDVVVARYTEPLDWLDDLKAVEPRLWIYNKGQPLGQASFKLPNIGREAHTYLHHICAYWDSLADWTVFCQGNPFDHCPDFVDQVLMWAVNPTGDGFVPFGKMDERGRPDVFRDDMRGVPWHGGGLDIEAYAEDFGIALPNPRFVEFVPGAQFAASRERIRAMPREFYTAIIDDMTKRPGRNQPWMLERVWSYLFGQCQLDKYRTAGIMSPDN